MPKVEHAAFSKLVVEEVSVLEKTFLIRYYILYINMKPNLTNYLPIVKT